jgi:hypothetical protein
MDIRNSLKGISRRSFLKAATAASAVAVAAPTAVTIEHRSRELEIEHRIARFLEDQLKTLSQFVWEEAPGPVEHLGNGLRYSPLNANKAFDNVRLFDSPVVAFASATDPLFEELKRPNVIGPNHMSPRQWLPNAKTVISYYYPLSEEIRASNRQAGIPSIMWLAGKASAEVFVYNTNKALTQFFAGLNATSVIPDTDSRFKMVRNGNTLLPSWSERHVGYVAGLGTFGLHKSLITEKGCAGRLGSLITTLELKPTTRPYRNKNAYCLFYLNGSCIACIDRCPGHAVTKTGNNQAAMCMKYSKETVVPAIAPLPYKGGCGKCLTSAPCEIGIPKGIKRLT